MNSIDELQKKYIQDLRALMPELEEWWKTLTGVSKMTDDAPSDVMARWPTGISGHPRVLDVFQTYFFELDYLNVAALNAANQAQNDAPFPSDPWGRDTLPESTGVQRPVDVLINDLETEAPDLAKLVMGIIMVPVGIDPEEEYF